MDPGGPGRADRLLEALRRTGRSPNRFQRAVRGFAGTRAGARLFSVLLRPADRLTLRLTSGRTTLAAAGAGVPVITLVTHGRRTRAAHSAPVATVATDAGLVVVGSNFGGPRAPSWALNLAANPRAQVEYRGVRVPVHARLLDGAEARAALAAACQIYPPFAAYVARAIREVPIFLLEPAAGD